MFQLCMIIIRLAYKTENKYRVVLGLKIQCFMQVFV